MTWTMYDPAQCYHEIDHLLDDLVGAWNRADPVALPAAVSSATGLPATGPNASLVIEWRRLTWISPD